MSDDRQRGPGRGSRDDGTAVAQNEMRQVAGVRLERLRNAVEVLACRMLERKLEMCPEIDKSPRNIEDMYCLALNRVPALYYHSASSFARRLEDQGPPSDIIEKLDRALDHAILIVGANPSRDDDEPGGPGPSEELSPSR